MISVVYTGGYTVIQVKQILSLGTKPFVIFTDALFKVDAYF